MDQGIITCLKRLYKYELVVDIIAIYTDPDIMDAEVASIKPGWYDGVEQVIIPRLHDSIVILNRIWDAIPAESVSKCWKKAECIPVDYSDDCDDGGADYYGVADDGSGADNNGG